MIQGKKGSYFRIISSIFGSALLLIALYFLNQEKFLYGGVMGIIGILLITISTLPFIKSLIKIKP